MTISVKVSVPNSQAIAAQVTMLSNGSPSETIVPKGKEVEFYVHNSQDLHIKEIPWIATEEGG